MLNNHILHSSFEDGLYRFQLDNGKAFSALDWNDSVAKARDLAKYYGYKVADLVHNTKEAIVGLHQRELNKIQLAEHGRAVKAFYESAMS